MSPVLDATGQLDGLAPVYRGNEVAQAAPPHLGPEVGQRRFEDAVVVVVHGNRLVRPDQFDELADRPTVHRHDQPAWQRRSAEMHDGDVDARVPDGDLAQVVDQQGVTGASSSGTSSTLSAGSVSRREISPFPR